MKTYKKHFMKNQKGMTLVEVVISMGILSMIGLASTIMMQNVLEMQQRSEAKSGLLTFRNQMISVINNETHWIATINASSNAGEANIGCLREESTFDCTAGARQIGFDLYTDTAGGSTLFYQGSSQNAGLTIKGTTCNTFPSLACPFRYNLTMITECSNGAATCPRPQISITANFAKSEDVNSSVISKIDTRTVAQQGLYSFQLNRSENIRNEPFELIQQSTGTGGGACAPNTWNNTRPLGTIVSNIGGHVSLASNTFTVPPGSYECTISAEGFDQIEGFKIRLRKTSGTPALTSVIGSAITANDASAIVSGSVLLEPDSTSSYILEQYCRVPSDEATIPNSDMGRPTASGGEIFTRVYCVRNL